MDKGNTPQQPQSGLVPAAAGPGGALKIYPRPVFDGPEEIRHEIEASRRQIAESLQMLQDEVETRVERVTDWRGLTREHPWATVGVAFALGFYLGLR